MDLDSESGADPFIQNAQEKTAKRTKHLLLAARFTFCCSHGVLMIVSSIKLGLEVSASWWAVFTPVWVGDSTCVAMILASLFASCPYIKACLAERQARLGDSPSILTELLPEIIIALLTFVCVILVLVGELLLCIYLGELGKGSTFVPSAVVLMIVSLLACCHGLLISTNGDLFNFVGGGVLVTLAIALAGPASWVLVIPATVSTFALLLLAMRRLYVCSVVLSREEKVLRVAELCVLGVVFGALLALVLMLRFASGEGQGAFRGSTAAAALGACAGVGICVVAGLRTRMTLVESRQTAIRERLVYFESPPASAAAPNADDTPEPDAGNGAAS